MSLVWIGATLLAAALQTARNAAQAGLVARAGTVGATAVRFLFGLPVALLLLLLVVALTGEAAPRPDAGAFGFALLGAVAQIAATGLMLAAMKDRSFAVTTAIVKLEPVLVAVFGFLVLGDALTPLKTFAILVATSGVLVVTGLGGAPASKAAAANERDASDVAAAPDVATTASGGGLGEPLAAGVSGQLGSGQSASRPSGTTAGGGVAHGAIPTPVISVAVIPESAKRLSGTHPGDAPAGRASARMGTESAHATRPSATIARSSWVAVAGPTLLGIAAAAGFGLAAVAFRGAIVSLDVAGPDGVAPSFLVRATTILALGLGLQSAILVVWLVSRDRRTLRLILEAWRPSLGAGALGALASQFWFIGFALTSAANVRTLALVEVLMAQGLSRRVSGRRTTRREALGMAIIVAGVALLLYALR